MRNESRKRRKGSNQSPDPVDPDTLDIREDFLSFVACDRITGDSIAQNILRELQAWGLSVHDIRGQGYDGASNMSGKFRGVQARIAALNQKAVYFHCASHALNLCVVKACTVQEVTIMFGLLKDLSLFFSGSPKRQRMLEQVTQSAKEAEKIPQSKIQKLVDLCRTRWVERHTAFEVFAHLFSSVVDCLEKMLRKKEEWDTDTLTRASGFLHAFKAGAFLVAFVVTRKCLIYIQPLTLKLQMKAKDIVAAYKEISQIRHLFQGIRDHIDDHFHGWFLEAEQMAAVLHCTITKPRGAERQSLRSNHPAENTEQFFKRSICIPFVDHLVSQLSDRFTTASEVAADGLQLVPECILEQRRNQGPAQHQTGFVPLPEGIQRLASFWLLDLPDEDSVAAEYHRGVHKWETEVRDRVVPDTAQLALKACDATLYPNVHQLLKLVCTLPITTAECERRISGLRTLKNYLRSTMGEVRLNGLALMRVHRAIQVDVEGAVDRFARRYNTIMRLLPAKMLHPENLEN